MTSRSFLIGLLFCLNVGTSSAQDPSSWGQEQSEYLLTGAKIMVSPGQTITKGNLYLKNGKVAALGAKEEGSPTARRIDLSGLVIHAGYIDPYVTSDRVGLKESGSTPISGKHPRVRDDFQITGSLELKEDSLEDFRQQGIVAVGVAPNGGIFRGQGGVYKTSAKENDSELVLKPQAYSVIGFEELGWSKLKGENYPLSMMGSAALIRQTFLDTAWYHQQGTRPEGLDYEGTLESLRGVTSGARLLVAETTDYLETLRMLLLLKEAQIPQSALVLSGEEWKNLPWFLQHRASVGSFILPLAFAESPKVGDGVTEEQFTVGLLRDWFTGPANPRWLQEKGVNFSFTTHRLKSVDKLPGRLQEAIEAGLSEEAALAALTTEPARLLGLSDFGSLQPGKSASFVVRDGEPFSGKTVIREVWVDGERYPDYGALAKGEPAEKDKVEPRDFVDSKAYSEPPQISPTVFSPSSVLIEGATVWTQEGRPLPQADLLVSQGKIVAVGPNLPSGGALVIDGQGLHVTPGLIDAHSHTAIDGDVNEPGANITAMVRIKDVIDPFDHDIYLQLASGVTAANLLHGSANAIGGQSITCKWKWGETAEGLIMTSAPEGIKFALGENPKQSNWGDAHTSRYPQSRLGVVESIRGAFMSARNYRKLQEQGKNPRPNLMLDALLEVIDGERLVHCHSYRQDEILALIQAAEEVGFKVNVFQHVLEGYKVAPEMARHGAAASTFADWWAYKVEVDDAIPHNASLMHEAGVSVSINSDSEDLARRLNTEAAKSLRYGGMSEVEALNMITKNAASQLGILDRVGTLSPGKDADFVIWSAHPLSQEAVVLETWIEGKRYFQRSQEAERADRLVAEREKYLKLLDSDQDDEEKKKK